MVAEHLAVVAHEDDQGVFAEAGGVELGEQPADLDVDQVAHRPVRGADQAVVVVFHLLVRIEAELAAVRPEVVDLLEAGLGVEFARDVVGERDLVEPVEVAAEEVLGRVERVVGVEAVDGEEPGIGVGGVAIDEVHRHLDAPGGLVVLLGDAGLDVRRPRVGVSPVGAALLAEPAGIVAGGPVVVGVVRPEELGVAVVDPPLLVGRPARLDGGEVELAREAAGVPLVRQRLRDQDLRRRDRLAVLAGAGGPGVAAGEEAGARGGAERVLAEGVGEEDARVRQGVDPGGADPRVAVAPQGVEALLVGADPQDVRSLHRLDPFRCLPTKSVTRQRSDPGKWRVATSPGRRFPDFHRPDGPLSSRRP